MSRVSAYRYRAQANDCRAQAELSRNEIDRDAWLVLSAEWTQLADSMDRQAATRPDRSLLSPIPGRRVRPMQLQGEMEKKLFDEQSLRLLRAFFSLQDTEVRAVIVNLVESTARGEAIPADGLREQLHEKSS